MGRVGVRAKGGGEGFCCGIRGVAEHRETREAGGGGREEGGRGSNTFIDIDGSETTTKRPSSSSLLCQDIQTAIYTAG